MKTTFVPVFMLVCVLITAVAFATPSTLIWVPSTDIQAENTKHFGVDMYHAEDGNPLLDYGLTLGVKNMEFGFDILHTNGGIDDPLRLNAKFLVADEKKSMPKITAGLFDAGGDNASNMAYILGSKTLPFARLTLGYCSGKKSVLGDDNKMIIAGIDKQLTEKIWCAADYQSGESSFGALSAGISYLLTKDSSILVGYDWYNNSETADTITIQYDINF